MTLQKTERSGAQTAPPSTSFRGINVEDYAARLAATQSNAKHMASATSQMPPQTPPQIQDQRSVSMSEANARAAGGAGRYPRLPSDSRSRTYNMPVQVYPAIFRNTLTDESGYTDVVLTGQQLHLFCNSGDTPAKAVERILAAQGLVLLELGQPEEATVVKLLGR